MGDAIVIAGHAGKSTVSTEAGRLGPRQACGRSVVTRFFVFFAVIAVLNADTVRHAESADLSAGNAYAAYCMGLIS